MSLKTYSRLTGSLIYRFGNRKQFGYLSLLVDVQEKVIYVVPHNKEHVAVACELIGDAFLQDPSRASHLVPSLIEVNVAGEVVGVVTGVSGLELGYRVRHKYQQLQLAHDLVLRFVRDGDLALSYTFQKNSKIVYQYGEK